jgi:hypothetical protein
MSTLNRTHGMSYTPEYRAWSDIKRRCLNPNCPTWKHYGARGIEVRFASFEAFFSEVGFRPSRKHSIHRIDNDGHYEPGNIAWVTGSIQARNKRIWKNAMRARKNAARIRKLYEAGSRYQDLATQFGIGKTTVRTLLKEQGYKPGLHLKPKTCSSRFRGVSWHKRSGQMASCCSRRSQAPPFGTVQTRDGCFCRVSSRQEVYSFCELTSLLSRYGTLPLLPGKQNSRGVFATHLLHKQAIARLFQQMRCVRISSASAQRKIRILSPPPRN